MPSVPPPSFEHPGSPPPRPELPEGVWRPDPAPPRAAALPRWPPWAPFAAMLGALVVAITGVGVIALVVELAGVDTGGDSSPPGVTIGGTYVQDLALIGSAVFLARLLDPPVRPAQFGLRVPPLGPAVGKTLAVWAAFFAFSIAWSALLGIEENDELPQELGADSSTVALVAVALLVCVLAPLAEELFFRGFCFTALRRTLGMLPAAALTGIIFGAIHLGGTEAEFIVPLMVFGALLCLLYAWSGSILACMVLHALNNGLALGVAEDWSAGATLLTMAAAMAVVLAVTLPIAHRAQQAPARTVRA